MRSPILFLVFNRPDITQRVFDAIRNAKPPKLYIASDGPRVNKAGEKERCREVQSIVSEVDWPCEVNRLVRDKNLGCKAAVSSALDWFFSCENEGIILEDDCLPHLDFFQYCDELLEKYRDDERVGLISGTSFTDLQEKHFIKDGEDYIFTRYPSIWGWASWKRVWSDYDLDIKFWKTHRQDISVMTPNLKLRKKNDWLFDQVSISQIDTWDYQVSFLLWSTGRISICPRFNLIENIGFGPDATHTKIKKSNDDLNLLSPKRLTFPLIPPKILAPNYAYQELIESLATKPILKKILDRLKNYVYR